MNKIKYLFFVLILSGCASQLPVPRNIVNIIEPQLNNIQTQELGNTLVQFYTATTMPSIEITQKWSTRRGIFDMPPQILAPIGKGEVISKYSITNFPPNASVLFRNVCFDSNDNSFFNVSGLDNCDHLIKSMSNSGPINVRPADYIDVSQPFFRQELIYNGRVNNNLKFMYREISGDYMRAPFTQEIQYDLSEGTIIGFKGARLEVIESSNRSITYKLLKMFDR